MILAVYHVLSHYVDALILFITRVDHSYFTDLLALVSANTIKESLVASYNGDQDEIGRAT